MERARSLDLQVCPLVTLAVKAYRQERTVAAAIESVFAQTYPNLEIILSDDCSPDETYAVMQQMADSYRGPHRVRLNRNAQNLGIVGHENRLWAMASGQLIGHCAGDDISLPDRIERQVAAWAAGGGDILAVHTAMWLVGADGEDLGLGRPCPASVLSPSLQGLVLSHGTGIGATALYDRRLFDIFGPIDEAAGIEDRPLFLRAAMAGRIAYLDEPLLVYCVDGASGRRQSRNWGHEYLYGARMRVMSWFAETDRLFLEDAAFAGYPVPEKLKRHCEHYIAATAPERALWKASPARRIAMLPRSVLAAARQRQPRQASNALKYALGPVYTTYYDWRHGAKWASVVDAGGEATVRRFKWADADVSVADILGKGEAPSRTSPPQIADGQFPPDMVWSGL